MTRSAVDTLSSECREGRGRLRGRGVRLGNDFNRVDRWVLNIAGERDFECPIGNFYRHGFDLRAIGSASLGPNVEVLEFVCPCNIEGEKHALARAVVIPSKVSSKVKVSPHISHWEVWWKKSLIE